MVLAFRNRGIHQYTGLGPSQCLLLRHALLSLGTPAGGYFAVGHAVLSSIMRAGRWKAGRRRNDFGDFRSHRADVRLHMMMFYPLSPAQPSSKVWHALLLQ